MKRQTAERGEGNLGCLLWAVVVIIVGYIAWTMVPVKIASAQLSDFMEEQAKFAEHRSPKKIEKAILSKASKLELPLEATSLKVERKGDYIYMDAEYTVPVEFVGGYVYEWHFEHHIDRPIFIF
ncbi:MAG: hypothetical protein PVG07_08540 [Acidobacteriota bacterium]|jgi:hypothetical protein